VLSRADRDSCRRRRRNLLRSWCSEQSEDHFWANDSLLRAAKQRKGRRSRLNFGSLFLDGYRMSYWIFRVMVASSKRAKQASNHVIRTNRSLKSRKDFF